MNDGPKIDLNAIGIAPKPTPTPKAASPNKQYGSKPGVFTFYKLKQPDPNSRNLTITKFNSNLDVESSYYMNYMPTKDGGYYDCQCPASKFDCRHKGLMKAIVEAGHINSEKFFCFETRMFKAATEIS